MASKLIPMASTVRSFLFLASSSSRGVDLPRLVNSRWDVGRTDGRPVDGRLEAKVKSTAKSSPSLPAKSPHSQGGSVAWNGGVAWNAIRTHALMERLIRLDAWPRWKKVENIL